MSTKRAYKQYTKEFKEEAVALVLEQGYSIAQAADSLGIKTSLLYKWKEKIEAEKEEGQEMTDNEREELKRLRKEVKELRMEKEILKKASAFFAKEMK